MATDVTITADKVVADTELKLNNVPIWTIVTSGTAVSTPGSDGSIVTEKALVNFVADNGWSVFTLASTPTIQNRITTTDTRIEAGLPIRYSNDLGVTWRYGMIFELIGGTTWKFTGAPVWTGVSSIVYQLGDRSKATQERFQIDSVPNGNVVPAISDGLLHSTGYHSHYVNIIGTRYIVEMGVMLGNDNSDASARNYYPSISLNGTTWNKANASNLSLTGDDSWQGYGKSGYVFDTSYYIFPFGALMDFGQLFSGSSAGAYLDIYITTIHP